MKLPLLSVHTLQPTGFFFFPKIVEFFDIGDCYCSWSVVSLCGMDRLSLVPSISVIKDACVLWALAISMNVHFVSF